MNKKSFLIGVAALMLPMAMHAQYTIYPVPHEQTAGTGKVSFTKNVNVICDNGIDQYTKKRVTNVFAEKGITVNFSDAASTTESNVYLGINGAKGKGNEVATSLGLALDVLSKENKFDRHILSLTDAGNGVAQLLVLGENTDATFMGLASLEQILDNGTSDLQTVTLNDYADLKERGIIEGFYGKPYSSEVRKDLLRFMMRNKMNCYVYGPKSDPYHSGKWSEPYPTTLTENQKTSGFVDQQALKDFTDVSHETKVSVVWAIHPGNSLLNDNNVVSKIMGKFENMYNLGFRQFAVFCDDVGVPSTQEGMDKTAQRVTDIQRSIESKWNIAGADPADTVKALRFTPQIYCRAFAGPDSQFNGFFQALSKLPANVTVYYTGGGVWSVPNNGDLNTVQNQFGRNVIWWWNYPCNDNGTGPNEIYPLDMKSNFYDMPNVNSNATIEPELTASNQGILCNPMEQGSASRTPVFSAGDYSWNNKGFDNLKSWEASFKSLFPGNEKLQKAYRFLAPYLSKNDPESLNKLISNYKSKKDGAELGALMDEIISNCEVMNATEHSSVVSDSLLYVDIKPWVLRLQAVAQTVKQFIAVKDVAEIEQAWADYRAGINKANTLSTADEFMARHMSGFGSDGISTEPRLTHASYRYLTPFVDYLKEKALDGKFSAETECKMFTNVEGAKLNIRKTSEKYIIKGTVTLPQGGYAGIELPAPTLLSSISIPTSVWDDADFKCMVSVDGKTWTPVAENKAASADYVHYFVILNASDAEKELAFGTGARLTETSVTVKSASAPSTNYWNNHSANLMADGSYNTYVCLNRVQELNDMYTIELSEPVDIRNVRIVMGSTNGDYPTKGTVLVSSNTSKWTQLHVAGTKDLVFKMDAKQIKKVGTDSDSGADIMALDFMPPLVDGKFTPINAKYVRFKVTGPNTNKWLRLHEIEVNGDVVNVKAPMQAPSGVSIVAASDNNPLSSSAGYTLGTAKGGEFVYNFNHAADVQKLILFCDENTLSGVEYAVTSDGENWTNVDAEQISGVVKFNFDKGNNIKALRITWNTATVPAIYEVSEQLNAEASMPVISRIGTVKAEAAKDAVTVSVKGNRIVAESATGLRSVDVYTLDGRHVLNQSLAGAHQATLPIVNAAVIVKVTLTNGTTQSFKLTK